MTKKHIFLIILTVLLGAAFGFIIVFAAVYGGLFAGLYEEDGFGVLTAIFGVCALSVPLGFLHIRINERLRLPHWGLIAITCTVPIIYSVYSRADFLYKVNHGGFGGFMGGLAQGLSDWISMGSIFASVAFLLSRIAAVLIIKKLRNSKKQ